MFFFLQISEFSGFICALCGGRDDLGVVKFFYIIILIALISTVIWFILYFIRRNRNPWSFLLKVEMYYHATGSIILLLAAVLILGYRVQALLVASVRIPYEFIKSTEQFSNSFYFFRYLAL